MNRIIICAAPRSLNSFQLEIPELSNKLLFSAVLSSIFLGEYLNKLRKAGILLSLVGSTMIVIHAPKHERVSTYAELAVRFVDICKKLFYDVVDGSLIK